MALVLNATPGDAAANVYCTALEADTYHDSHVSGADWFTYDPPTQEKALVHATRLLDDYVEWEGNKTSRTQALRWPRTGVEERDGSGSYYDTLTAAYTIDPTIIPAWLKNATAELARWLLASDRTKESDVLEYTSLSIGSLSLTKDASAAGTKEVIPDAVQMMVADYGDVHTKGGMSIVRMERA